MGSEESAEVATLRAHDVLEVLEGPRKEGTGKTVRAYGSAVGGGPAGWFTVTSRNGQECAVPATCKYTCKSAIALTSEKDISTCEVMRKLDKGELLTGLIAPEEDGETGVFRVRVKAAKDSAEGWVTLKGNAGTVYVEESGSQYKIVKKIPLQTGFQASSDELRMIAEDELFNVLQGPKEEQAEPVVRAKVRAASSGAEGWVTIRPKNLRLWAPRYRCLVGVPLQDDLKSDSKTVRALEIGEILELLDGPKGESTTSALRLKVRAAKDGVVGWVSAAGSEGKLNLECVRSA